MHASGGSFPGACGSRINSRYMRVGELIQLLASGEAILGSCEWGSISGCSRMGEQF